MVWPGLPGQLLVRPAAVPDLSAIYAASLVNDWDAVNKVLNGGDVSQVTDAQANDNIVQTNPVIQPLWVAAGGPGPHGAPSINHNAANADRLQQLAYGSLGADVSYTVGLVFKVSSWSAFHQIFLLEDAAGGDTIRIRERTGADRYELTFNNSVSTSTTEGAGDANWHVMWQTYDDAGQLAGFAIDNGAAATVATGAFSEAIGRVFLASSTNNANLIWTRCFVIDRLATAPERTDTGIFLNSAYGNGGGPANIPTLTW